MILPINNQNNIKYANEQSSKREENNKASSTYKPTFQDFLNDLMMEQNEQR